LLRDIRDEIRPKWALAWVWMLTLGLVGCNYSKGTAPLVPSGVITPGANVVAPKAAGGGALAPKAAAAFQAGPGEAQKAAILDSSVRLIQTAGIKPGGDNFGIAIKNLNQFFAGTAPSEYILRPESREYLEGVLPKGRVDQLESPTWALPDARHVEDCMLYHAIAARIAGPGDDLTRVRRVFDWMVRQIQLVPAGALSPSAQLGQAYARPFDVLLRGMATEAEGFWSERGWLFLSLCRQLGLDGGLVAYSPPGAKTPVIWCVAILIDGKPYLFDTRIGLPIPDAQGDGVATLDEALTIPAVLDRLDLPGQSPYGTNAAALRGSTTKIGILLDSSLRYFAPRMKLLQARLAGKDLSVLYRDPAIQRDQWAKALGPRLGTVGLWELPMTVETLLFTNPNFVQSTQHALFLFKPEFPLLYARMKELRGETSEAIQDYVSMRFAENALLMDKKSPMPPEVQRALDVYATYFLAMCHLDQHDSQQAERFFERTLKMLPAPSSQQPYYSMYRWGAQANLARLREAKGDISRAIALYSQRDPTTQGHGNLFRARALLWPDPTAPVPAPLPPPPSPPLFSLPGPQASR
jgi:hypothetical protein